ncbi:hypothetical protein TNCV_4394841 [Trichonephila clavipes]|uniref:Uncharacterized protein n=1 Tax=Trichonephila clavipes TaxID=2585209 RepID=A0A8X6W4Y6_TRICX|nr:hypothetical protein TNCV_4394841 [Trichonephila clavipes]
MLCVDRVFLSGTNCSKKTGKEWKITTTLEALPPARPPKHIRVKNLLNSDRWMSIKMISDELSIPQTQVFEILTRTLAMRIPRSGVSCPSQCGNTASSL